MDFPQETNPQVPSDLPPQRSRFWEILKIVLIVLVSLIVLLAGLVGTGVYLIHKKHPEIFTKRKPSSTDEVFLKGEREKIESQAQMNRALAPQMDDFRFHSATLPSCPLIFPLLDGQGRVTPLGTYLSIVSMRQATYLPESVFQLCEPFSMLSGFNLFTVREVSHSTYRTQLPLFFRAKDFGEGTLRTTREGYQITLRFWGTKPEKKFQKTFPKAQLHLSIGWIAECLHKYTGDTLTPSQVEALQEPVFKNEKDLIHAAEIETYFRNDGERLVLGWDDILSKNPECPYLVVRKIQILNSIDDYKRISILEPLLKKHPNNSYYKYITAWEYIKSQQYDAALDLAFSELRRDDDNLIWYQVARSALVKKGNWIGAYRLLTLWFQKHPDDPTPLLELGRHMREWAWNARGTGYAYTVPKAAWPIFQKRIAEGYGFIQQAMAMAPDDWRVWNNGLNYGNGADLDLETMQNYFDKARTANPDDRGTYFTYLERLKPKWSGNEQIMLDFAKLHSDIAPFLMVKAATDRLYFTAHREGSPMLSQDTRDSYLRSPYWTMFEKYIRICLKNWPYDISTWKMYLSMADIVGKTSEVYQYAGELAKGDPNLAALHSALLAQYHNAHYYNLETEKEKSAYWNSQEVIDESLKESLEMQTIDPGNWYWANKALCTLVQKSQKEEAVRIWKLIGEAHWDANVCSKKDWETVQTWANAGSTPASNTPTSVPTAAAHP